MKDYLKKEVVHFDIKSFNSVPLIEQFGTTAFQARNLARAAKIYNQMIQDKNCAIILCLSGSLFSAGLKKVVYLLAPSADTPVALTMLPLVAGIVDSLF